MTHLYIVTGSSRGVGAALVAQLLQPGNTVLGMARRQNEDLRAQAEAARVPLTQWSVDLAQPASVATELAAWLGGFDGQAVTSATLINNAGVIASMAPLGQVPLAELSNALRVGLESTMLLGAAFLQATNGWGGQRNILNISSGLGRRAMAGSAVYCAAKAGMDHWTRAVAMEEASRPKPVRVASIAPGVIDTDMQAQLRGADPELFPDRARFIGLRDNGDLITPEACAKALLAKLARPDFGAEPIGDIRD